MSSANNHPSITGQAQGFGQRVACIARHLAARGFRLRNTGNGWRIEPSTAMRKPPAGRIRP
jgi:hypothetical protein